MPNECTVFPLTIENHSLGNGRGLGVSTNLTSIIYYGSYVEQRFAGAMIEFVKFKKYFIDIGIFHYKMTLSEVHYKTLFAHSLARLLII